MHLVQVLQVRIGGVAKEMKFYPRSYAGICGNNTDKREQFPQRIRFVNLEKYIKPFAGIVYAHFCEFRI